jgi:Putative DNA-binding domain
MRLTERQHGFAAALLDPELPAPAGLVGPDGEPSSRRFAVYRNNVVMGLIEALRAAFPAVSRIVGGDFFMAMARAYIAKEPPDSPIMLDYGAGFPDFIDLFELAATLPYLADVARIERAWSEAYHAREATLIEPSEFMTITPDQMSSMRLAIHPSLRVVRSSFPALTIWQMNVAGGVPAPVDLSCGEDALVLRPRIEVEVRSLLNGSAEFIEALTAGSSVITALEAALAVNYRFNLAGNLADLMQAGALTGYDLESEAE